MSHPLVSVVMSVYNAEKFLSDAIKSILNQSFKDFEFIIIEDSSTDHSLDIIKEFQKQDNRITIIEKEKNEGSEGFIKNLNFGLEIAKGKYIARMDADDISSLDRFQKQVDFLETHQEISLVGAQINFINEKNEIIGEKIGALEHEEIVHKISSKIQLFHPVIMFRNNESIRYREKFVYCEDYDLYLYLITQGKKLANIDEKLLNYRILDNSISRKGDNFIKKLMLEKALYFYQLRIEKGQDLYEDFNNQEVLEIKNLDFKSNIGELFFSLDAAIKLNRKNEINILIQKIRKFYPEEKVPFKYIMFSKASLLVFRIMKKLF